MPLLEALAVGPDTAQWTIWGSTARIVVTQPHALPQARRTVEAELAAIGQACDRFRADSELRRLPAGRTVEVSPVLAELVAVALDAAERTGGDVDPTLGGPLAALGYDRDFLAIRGTAGPVPTVVEAGWRRVRLHGRLLAVPSDVELDLGATAKAYAADRCASVVAGECGVGVLVALGGDIATAGAAPEGGWRVLVRDLPGDPQCTVALPAGAALATSSTASRSWRLGGHSLHHILDPRTCLPAAPVWRTVSVAAHSCLRANTLSTAAVVRGHGALSWLREQGVPARLVTPEHRVITVGGWPS